jgi:retron-type reverse transcriptase
MVKDRSGIAAFGADLETNALNLANKIQAGNYQPQTGFKFYEPKSSGTQRTKTLLFVEDALVYQAIANVIAQRAFPKLAETDNFVYGSVLVPEVIFGTDLLNFPEPSYFFFKFWKTLYNQFKDSVIKAIEEDKATFKFETDITGFFDSIPHYNLLLTLSTEFGVEDEILDLLSECLNAWSGTKESSTPGVGIPQGPVPSFFLANLLLHQLDKKVIGEAFKYYRYMDDIHIYGYSEEELLDVLVMIDTYLKGHGLSINSKKTRIEKIDPTKEDETVKALRRFEVISEQYEGQIVLTKELEEQIAQELFLHDSLKWTVIETFIVEEEKSKEKEAEEQRVKKITKNLSTLFEQTNDSEISNPLISITDPEEIKAFWKAELKSVEEELPALFTSDQGELVLKDESTDDIDFIRLSAQYGNALQALKQLEPVNASVTLLPYWLFALKKYYWRASNYVITLQHYAGNAALKERLMELYSTGKNYESYRYHLLTCLTYRFSFSDRELRDYYKKLKEEPADLVKYAWYCLLIRHSNDPQLNATLKTSLSNEKSEYLKLIVLEYWKRDEHRTETMQDLIKSIGL